MDKDHEAIYDQQISPLMKEIVRICRENHIPMVASFEYAPEHFCSTIMLQPNCSDNLKAAANLIQKGFMAFAITQGGRPFLT